MFKYGNPIVLEGSGRIKTDPLNERRIEEILSRFEGHARTQGILDKFSYSITREQSSRSLVAFPAAGFAVCLSIVSSECLLRTHLCIPTRVTSANFSPCWPLGLATKCMKSTKKPIITRAALATFGIILQTSAECSITMTRATHSNGSNPTICPKADPYNAISTKTIQPFSKNTAQLE